MLEDSILSYKKLRNRETMFSDFFDKLDESLSDKACSEIRRGDSENYCYRHIIVRDINQQISQLLTPNAPVLSESYLTLQFTTNNSRAAINERCCKILNIKRKVQSHTLDKKYPDAHHANKQCKIIRNRMVEEGHKM